MIMIVSVRRPYKPARFVLTDRFIYVPLLSISGHQKIIASCHKPG